jgi:septal ring factor EnvC (AmiA/AmiB activator)
MEAASWAGFAMAGLSLAGTVFANINARKVARDKADFDRLAAKDKQDFDLKMMEIQKDSEYKDAQLAEVREELAKCREQHEASERDRDQLRAKLAELERHINSVERKTQGA